MVNHIQPNIYQVNPFSLDFFEDMWVYYYAPKIKIKMIIGEEVQKLKFKKKLRYIYDMVIN